MSGAVKALLIIVLIGIIGTGAYLVLRPDATPPVVTPLAQVSPTEAPADTPTVKPPTNTPTATKTPSRTPSPTPTQTPTRTPTPSPTPLRYGSISGRVLGGGQSMAEASVQLAEARRRIKPIAVTTNADGFYQIDRVPAGVYRVTAETRWGAAEPIEVTIAPNQAASGDLTVITPIDQKYQQYGRDFFGQPLGSESETGDSGRFREFERATIYWRRDLGAYEVHGDILARWLRLGGALGSKLGYPVSDELDMPDGRGRYNDFEYGGIYWTPENGAHELRDVIREVWLNKYRAELGYPRTDQRTSSDGSQVFNVFERGCIGWYPASGQVDVFFDNYSTDIDYCLPIPK